MGSKTVLIVPDNDILFTRTKFWLISRGKQSRTIYIPLEDEEEKQPVIVVNLTLFDRLLYSLTFKRGAERVSCFH